MFSTSYKKWLTALVIDSTIIGLLVAGVVYRIPHTLDVGAFFLWWISGLTIFTSSLLLFVFPTLKAAMEKNKELGDPKEFVESVWKPKMVRSLAYSNTFLTYHWLTDVSVWVLLLIAGHPILACVKAFSFLLSLAVISVARDKYREANMTDLEKSFKKHRAAVQQHNNVAAGDIAGGDIYK